MLRPRFALAFSMLALIAGCGGDDPAAPTNNLAFEGAAWVVPDSAGKLVVAWKPIAEATDYRVYVSAIQGRPLKTAPTIRTTATSVTITPDEPGVRYYVVVRAGDAAGLEDRNTKERSAVALPDTVLPSFGGVKAVEPAGNAGAKVSWDIATDDQTPSEAIVYDVYAGRSRTALGKVATTGPGETSITFNALGLPAESFVFSVRARDVANNVSPEGNTIASVLGQDATPPIFAGCDVATSLSATSARITWLAATDNATPASGLTYEIYAATAPRGQDFNAPPLAKVEGGATMTTLTGLQPGVRYFFVCRARDLANNVELNTNEREVATAADVTKPQFAGISSAVFSQAERTVALTWNAAKDDQTAQKDIVYDVYESRISNTYDFDGPPRSSSAPGASSILLVDLATRGTLNWVVRARDATGNHDDNVVERSGTTLTSYKVDVQGVWNRNCAVVGCHVSGPQTGALNLTPAFSYDQLVDVVSVEKRPMLRVAKGNTKLDDSWLYLKITDPGGVGLLMPAPQTGNALSTDDKSIITSWITEGAKNN